MLKNKRGAIVNMSSGYGLSASPAGMSACAASKHGVVSLTKAAALEYADSGIRVNALVRGWWILSSPGKQADATTQAPEQRILNSISAYPFDEEARQRTEVPEAPIWLCSNASSYVNGHKMTGAMAWIGRVRRPDTSARSSPAPPNEELSCGPRELTLCPH